jgi:hypothetical protein
VVISSDSVITPRPLTILEILSATTTPTRGRSDFSTPGTATRWWNTPTASIDAGAVLYGLTPAYGFNARTLTATDGTRKESFVLSGSYTGSGFYLTADAHVGTEVHDS